VHIIHVNLYILRRPQLSYARFYGVQTERKDKVILHEEYYHMCIEHQVDKTQADKHTLEVQLEH